MTDYTAIPRMTLKNILEAPTTYQALQKALAHLAQAQETIAAMSRTMDAFMEDDVKRTPGEAEVLQLGWFIANMGSDITVEWSLDRGFIIKHSAKCPGPLTVSDKSALKAAIKFKEQYEYMVRKNPHYSDNRFQGWPYVEGPENDD